MVQPPDVPSSASRETDSLEPLRSVHTNSFGQVLKQLNLSLVISTYQAGKLIVLRAEGDTVNTHFRIFQKPMGIAATSTRMALGTGAAIWTLHNVPSAAKQVKHAHPHDACFIPRDIHVTGDIDIHEMAWADGELWFLNTRFSCLCTLDSEHSFVPRWRPPFISAYDLRDRCHLNGLAIKNNKPKYVTALGATDTPGGWRNNKASGGILIDVETNEILIEGLSMPHSPRWYNDRLWVCESGKGSLSYLDDATGALVTVATLPGFTRGLSFVGAFAFVGLSQIRETAAFSGLPLTQSLTERICGVWVVNIHTGETVAFLKFEAAVQEIFAVAALPGIGFPEVLDWSPEIMGTAYVLPDEAIAQAVMPSADWEFAETHFAKGNERYGQQDFVGAIASYKTCLLLQPSYLPAQFNLAIALSETEQYIEAEQALRMVLIAEARHADAWNSLGFVLGKQGRNGEAVEAYEQAISIRPDDEKVRRNLEIARSQQR